MTNREIDALVAEKVMGWDVGHQGRERLGIYPRVDLYSGGDTLMLHTASNEAKKWHPTEDIAAAWQVADKMREKLSSVDIGWDWESKEWCCRLVPNCAGPDSEANAKTATLAICKAALHAVGFEVAKC